VYCVKYELGPVSPAPLCPGEKGDDGRDEGEIVSGVDEPESEAAGRCVCVCEGGRGIGSPAMGTGAGVVRCGNGMADEDGEEVLDSRRWVGWERGSWELEWRPIKLSTDKPSRLRCSISSSRYISFNLVTRMKALSVSTNLFRRFSFSRLIASNIVSYPGKRGSANP